MAIPNINGDRNVLMTSYQASEESADDPIIVEVLKLARSTFGMQVAFVSQIEDGLRIFRYVETDSDFSIIKAGDSNPLDEGYCKLVVDGKLPNFVPDAQMEPAVREIPATREVPIGAHFSVPLKFRDGSVYGTFCCFGTFPSEPLSDREEHIFRSFAAFTERIIEKNSARIKHIRDTRERLASVISEKRFVTHFQPIIRLSENRVIGYEALTRFTDEPIRSPDKWFDEALSVDMNGVLELAAIRSALNDFRYLPDDVYVSLNISPETILEGNLEDLLAGQPLDRIVIEVTEHSLVDDYDEVGRVLRPMRDKGLLLAVDDAGAGYASFRHILKMKPEIVKLDSSLVQKIDSDAGVRALSAALIRFADETGSKVVAEGVETESELRVLRELNVNKVQGYLLGKPAPLQKWVS